MQSYNIKFKIIFALIFFTGVFLLPKISLAATLNVDNCEQVDVQTAINSAQEGDTVVIPAGSCTWSAFITVTKGINIQGVGRDSTILTTAGGIATIFNMNVSSPKTWKIKDINFRGGGGGSTDAGLVTVGGTATGWRITANKFSDFVESSRAITVSSKDAEGLIDNNLFTSSVRGGNIDIRGSLGSADGGYAQWNIPFSFGGSSRVIFIEDNQWVGNFNQNAGDYFWVTDGYYGGRFVFRYNSVTNYNLTWHGCDSSCRGMTSAEIYNNTFTNNKTSPFYAIGRVMSHRSGTALIYNNTVTGYWTEFSTPYAYRNKEGTNKSWMGDPWSYCDGRPWKFCAGARSKACRTDADCTWGSGPCQYKVCSGQRDLQCTTDTDCAGKGTCSEYLDGRNAVSGAQMIGMASCETCSTTVLEVSGNPWTANALVNNVVWNTTANSWCKITANTQNIITCGVALQYDNYTLASAWQDGDSYLITDGYPCRDQPGVGPAGQVSQPFYAWNNSYCKTGPACVPVANAGLMGGAGSTIENRDYFNNTVFAGYTPYPYPHPLRQDDLSSDTTPPASPTGVQVQ